MRRPIWTGGRNTSLGTVASGVFRTKAGVGQGSSPKMDAADAKAFVAGLQVNERQASTASLSSSGGMHASQSALEFEKLMQFSDGELLCKAAASGEVSSLRRLVERGADVNAADYDRRSALHVACAEGHMEAVKFLVEKGANVNSEDRWGGR